MSTATVTCTCPDGHQWAFDQEGIAPGAVIPFDARHDCPECGKRAASTVFDPFSLRD